ncbi:MAG: hypothetical protein HRT57_12245 [Crocinitomicaceae bacterium]|nr:hypothetical protein [Crocinitomicaceae bacterium]
MKKFRVLFALVCMMFILSNCNEPSTIEEDVAQYCECIKERQGRRRKISRPCRKLRKTIMEKFEGDDEALDYLSKHQFDCSENW